MPCPARALPPTPHAAGQASRPTASRLSPPTAPGWTTPSTARCRPGTATSPSGRSSQRASCSRCGGGGGLGAGSEGSGEGGRGPEGAGGTGCHREQAQATLARRWRANTPQPAARARSFAPFGFFLGGGGRGNNLGFCIVLGGVGEMTWAFANNTPWACPHAYLVGAPGQWQPPTRPLPPCPHTPGLELGGSRARLHQPLLQGPQALKAGGMRAAVKAARVHGAVQAADVHGAAKAARMHGARQGGSGAADMAGAAAPRTPRGGDESRAPAAVHAAWGPAGRLRGRIPFQPETVSAARPGPRAPLGARPALSCCFWPDPPAHGVYVHEQSSLLPLLLWRRARRPPRPAFPSQGARRARLENAPLLAACPPPYFDRPAFSLRRRRAPYGVVPISNAGPPLPEGGRVAPEHGLAGGVEE
jgi:hypothetical protein